MKQLIRIWRQRYSKTVNCEPALLPAASLPAMATRIRTRLPPATRREEILDAAGRLFAERGYAAVSASEVAREAGVTPGLLITTSVASAACSSRSSSGSPRR